MTAPGPLAAALLLALLASALQDPFDLPDGAGPDDGATGILGARLEGAEDPFALPGRGRRALPTWPERNPFLFAREQEAGLSLAALEALEQDEEERRRRALEEERERQRAELLRLQAITKAAQQAQGMRLRAVMIGRDDRRALVDGRIVREGERIPGTDLEVAKVTPAGIVVRTGGEQWVVLLPPPGSSPPRRARAEEPEPEAPTPEEEAPLSEPQEDD